jgi:GntR family transcriptional repressor for pyruvate dehydrogenase complex
VSGASSSRGVAGEPKRSDGIYESVFELIVSGDYPEHSRLPSEAELSRRFGASRPVVREALGRLRADGLIASRQGSGSYVKRRPDSAVLRFVPVASVADIQRCYEFRVGLEGAAASLAAERWQDEDLAEIQAALSDLEVCIRENRLGVEADARFHLAVARATHNSYHLSVQQTLAGHIAVGMNLARNLSLLRPAARMRIVQDEHEVIVEALAARDPARARQAMERHIANARQRIFEGTPPEKAATDADRQPEALVQAN